jgi:hypothetical protein
MVREPSFPFNRIVVLADVEVPLGTVIRECCGCGMPVDQTNPRCEILYRKENMGTYGPCCANMKLKEHRKWGKNREKSLKREAKDWSE